MPRKKSNKPISLFDVAVAPKVYSRVQSVLRSAWLSTGAVAREFEKSIGTKTKCHNCVAVNSATSGLQLALMASHVGGREVITTPLTMVATIEAILLAGGKPVFADIDPDSLNIDSSSVAHLCNKNSAAILSVDLGGNPADYAVLNSIAPKHRIPLISDAAHSFAAKVGNRSVASCADHAVFSFYATKNLSSAEGGMVISKRKSDSDLIRRMSRHGMTTNAFLRKIGRKWKYDVPSFGIKANLSDVHAAIGVGMLTQFESDQAWRRKCAERYSDNLKSLSGFVSVPCENKGSTHGWHLYIIRLNLAALRVSRDSCIDLMNTQRIECGLHYRPIYELSWYKRLFKGKSTAMPNARKVAPTIMSLPLHPRLSMSDVDRVCDTLAGILRRNRR